MSAKTPLNHTKMRTAYYEVVDKLPALLDQAKELNDEELTRLALEMTKMLQEYGKTLDLKYIWD